MKPRDTAFSLLEVTVALGIVAFALLAINGLIPVALQASRDAMADTRTSMIMHDAMLRAGSLPAPSSSTGQSTAWWYDSGGRYLDLNADTTLAGKAYYRASVTIGKLSSYPDYTDPTTQYTTNGYSTKLMGVQAKIQWPVDPMTMSVQSNGKSSERNYSSLIRIAP